MEHLPSSVTEQLKATTKEMKVVFEITSSGKVLFVDVNQAFVDFHKGLGVELDINKLLGSGLEDYFRSYLGFTNDQISSRMMSFHQALKTGSSYSFKEISDHPGIEVMILDSVWHPIVTSSSKYMIWESNLYAEERG